MSLFGVNLNFLSSNPWFTNEGLANIAYNELLPLYYSNYGGDLQVSIYNNDFMPDNITYLFNPLAMQYTGTPMMTGGYFGNGQIGVDSSSAQQLGEEMANDAAGGIAKNNYAQAIQSLESSLKKVESRLSDEDLDAEEKTKLEELKTKIEEKLKETRDSKSQATGSEAVNYIDDSQNKLTEAKDIAKEVQETVGNVSLKKTIAKNKQDLNDQKAKLDELKTKLEALRTKVKDENNTNNSSNFDKYAKQLGINLIDDSKPGDTESLYKEIDRILSVLEDGEESQASEVSSLKGKVSTLETNIKSLERKYNNQNEAQT